MFETNSRHIYVYPLWLAVIAAVLSPMYLSLSCSKSIPAPLMAISFAAEPNSTADSDSPTDIEQRSQSAALQVATRSATAGFKPSLEMKENVDFLLTPSLLMQEVLSDEIITTYPSE